ncbi:hypothetical protein H0H92_012201 [Tricholoma furcatifolium]|nr:hypothetical protein H0H92_012201 [Tricholoma furcatifolium]
MTLFSLADVLFINNLEESVCRTNQYVLSEADTIYARTLLSVSQNALLELEESQSISGEVTATSTESTHSRHVSILSVALAPHRRIPPEIIARIDTEEELEMLKYFVDTYPDICHLELYVEVSAYDSLKQADLTRYLSRADSFWWSNESQIAHSNLKDLMKALPPNVFSRLETLSVHLLPVRSLTGMAADLNVQVHSYPDLFGPYPRLRDLRLRGDSPDFLFSGIPWPLLRNLSIEIDEVDPLMQGVWTRIGQNSPFGTMASLETLTLQLPGTQSDIILSIDFPWHQIKSLTLECPLSSDPPNIAIIVRALSKCSQTLSHLDLFHVYDPDLVLFNNNFGNKEQLVHLSLVNLNIRGALPSSIIKSITASEQLLTLTIKDFDINLELFYVILEQCPNLKYLECAIFDDEPVQLLQAQKAVRLKTLSLEVSDVFFLSSH